MAAPPARAPNDPISVSDPASSGKRPQRAFLPRRALPRRLLIAAACFIVLGTAIVIHSNVVAIWSSHGRIHSDLKDVPEIKVGLVFGTTDRVNGRENLYFRYRIDAATELWNAGKIKTLLVSGDNRSHRYNEPEKMRRALVKRGIPNDRIVCDYAGFRTFDSVVRAKEIFGLDSLLVISQRFQNERAIYIARANGIDAHGYNARDVMNPGGLRTKMREIGARVLMWFDVNVLGTRPHHLGEKETLPE